jgi:intracellular sulfur oxidation DsrE/DsrF family protein
LTPQTTAAFEVKLTAAAETRFAAFKALKQSQAVGLCEEQLRAHERRLRAAAAQADVTPAALAGLIRKELDAYDRATAGPAKWHKAALFLADEGLTSLVRCAETREEKVGTTLKAATKAAEVDAHKALAKVVELEKAVDMARSASHAAEVQLAKLMERESHAMADLKECRREMAAATKDAAMARAEAVAARGEAQLKAASVSVGTCVAACGPSPSFPG